MDRRESVDSAPGPQLPAWLKLIHNQPIFLAAVAFGIVAGLHNLIQQDIAMIAVVVATPAAILGFAKPKRAWLWAGIIGLGLPVSELARLLPGVDSLMQGQALSGSTEQAISKSTQAVLVMVLAECSAGAGLLIRKSLSRFSFKD